MEMGSPDRFLCCLLPESFKALKDSGRAIQCPAYVRRPENCVLFYDMTIMSSIPCMVSKWRWHSFFQSILLASNFLPWTPQVVLEHNDKTDQSSGLFYHSKHMYRSMHAVVLLHSMTVCSKLCHSMHTSCAFYNSSSVTGRANLGRLDLDRLRAPRTMVWSPEGRPPVCDIM